MISQIRNSEFFKLFWVLMGLYLLNISADSADPYPQHISEDLSINDQESFIELVVEKILGYENAIEEYDDNDTEDHGKNTIVKPDLIAQYTSDSDLKGSFATSQKQKFSEYNSHLICGFQDLDTPPPKI